jgi:hypothetical protein
VFPLLSLVACAAPLLQTCCASHVSARLVRCRRRSTSALRLQSPRWGGGCGGAAAAAISDPGSSPACNFPAGAATAGVGPFAGGSSAEGSIVDSVVGNAATAADACSTLLHAGCASKLPEMGPASDVAEMWQVTAGGVPAVGGC